MASRIMVRYGTKEATFTRESVSSGWKLEKGDKGVTLKNDVVGHTSPTGRREFTGAIVLAYWPNFQ